MTTRTIIVAAREHDKNSYPVQKYDNYETWNRINGWAPNGTPATTYHRKTEIDPQDREIKWLIRHIPANVAGMVPHRLQHERVKCYNYRTEADMLRFENKPNAENIIAAYDLENVQCMISDWLFPVIEINETDDQYWDRVLREMKQAGVRKIEIEGDILTL